jgi:proline dehydrogenase
MASPLRHFLIALSKNQQMQDVIVNVPVSREMARRFIAGETLAEGIAAIRSVNANGLLATVDYLGEHVTTEAEATANADEYIRTLLAIKESSVNANISIKLTAMGLAIDDDFCYANVRRIVDAAAGLGNFVRIDMEDSPVTDRTLAIYRRLRRDYDNVGVVIQAYLYRSRDDEPPHLAYQESAEVDRSFVELIKLMLDGQPDHPGTYPAIASHDHRIINWTKAYAYHRGIASDRFEFQMLYGIRRDLQQALVDQGYRMRVYIPYGTRWYPYYMRRLAERPANLLFFMRALVGQ